MKWITCILGVVAYATTLATYAAATPPAKSDDKYIGTVHLDESKDVFFELLSSTTFTIQLLQTKNKFHTRDLILGGALQADAQHWEGDLLDTTPPQHYQDGNGIFITQATFDAMLNVNNGSTLFFSIADGHVGRGSPDGNDVFVMRAFSLFGNLDKYPLYITAGINTVPFGVFTGSGPWNMPLTGSYFNPTQAPQVSLGFFKSNLNINVITYKDPANHEQHHGYSLYYNKAVGNFNASIGAGYLNDLKTNSTGSTPLRQQRKRHAPAGDMGEIWDVNGSLGYKQVTLFGEYVTGSFKLTDNNAPPQAMGFTLTYTPKIFGTDTTFGIAHSLTLHLKNTPTNLVGYDELALTTSGIKSNWALSASRSIFMKNFVLGLDMERTFTYSRKHSNTFTLDLMAYL